MKIDDKQQQNTPLMNEKLYDINGGEQDQVTYMVKIESN